MRASRSVSKRCVRSLAYLIASFVNPMQCSTKPSTSMPRKTMVSSEKCENVSFLAALLPTVSAFPQYSRNACIHCSDGVSLSFTRTCPCSSTSRPSATIEVLMMHGILANGFDLSALRGDSSPNHATSLGNLDQGGARRRHAELGGGSHWPS